MKVAVHANGLTAPVGYWSYSVEQLADLANGCGPKGWGWLVPDHYHWLGFDITIACNIHDVMYAMGYDKKVADTIFFANCSVLAERAKPGGRVIAHWLAFHYYLAVKNLGAGFYKGARVTT